MKNILLIAILFCCHAVQAQITFQKNYGADTSAEEGRMVIQAADSGYFACGHRLTAMGYSGQGMLLRTDKNGNKLWTKYYSYPGASHVRLDHMSATSDGKLVVTGQIYYNVSNFDVYLAKLDTAGNVLWQKSYGGTGRQRGNQVKETFDKGFAICGYYDSLSNGSTNVYMIKADSMGDSLWAKVYAQPMRQHSHAIEQMPDSGFVMAGAITDSNTVTSRVYVVRTDKYGDTVWTKRLLTLDRGIAADILAKPNGNCLITGFSSVAIPQHQPYLAELDAYGNILWYEVYVDGPVGVAFNMCRTADNGYALSGNDTNGNYYVIKTDSLGQQQWFRKIDETASDWGYGIKQTNDGGYIITGTSVYDITGGTSPNLVLIKLDSNGTLSSRMLQTVVSSRVSVFPNPARGVVYINNKANAQIEAIELYDLAGKLVCSYDATKTSINTSGLSKGMYLLKFVTGSDVQTSKLLIE